MFESCDPHLYYEFIGIAVVLTMVRQSIMACKVRCEIFNYYIMWHHLQVHPCISHASVDLEQQEALNEYLLKLRTSGVGLILVTHSLNFAQRYADTILVLETGLVTDLGDRHLLKHPSSRYLQRAKRLLWSQTVQANKFMHTGGADIVKFPLIGQILTGIYIETTYRMI